jgi:hypothetical protein
MNLAAAPTAGHLFLALAFALLLAGAAWRARA